MGGDVFVISSGSANNYPELKPTSVLGGREWIDCLSESFIHVGGEEPRTVTCTVQPQSIVVDYLWLSMGTQLDSINQIINLLSHYIWSPPQSHQFR